MQPLPQMKSPSRDKLLHQQFPTSRGIARPSAHLEKPANAWVQGNPSLLCNWCEWKLSLSSSQRVKHLISLQQALRYFQPLCELLGVLGVSVVCVVHCSFLQGSRSLSAAGCLISNPPCGWKTHIWQHLAVSCAAPWFFFWFDICCDFLNLTRMVLLWSMKPCAHLVVVLLQFDESRFRLGRKGEGQYQLSISVHRSRSSLFAMHDYCLAECELFCYCSTYLLLSDVPLCSAARLVPGPLNLMRVWKETGHHLISCFLYITGVPHTLPKICCST